MALDISKWVQNDCDNIVFDTSGANTLPPKKLFCCGLSQNAHWEHNFNSLLIASSQKCKAYGEQFSKIFKFKINSTRKFRTVTLDTRSHVLNIRTEISEWIVPKPQLGSILIGLSKIKIWIIPDFSNWPPTVKPISTQWFHWVVPKYPVSSKAAKWYLIIIIIPEMQN